MIAFASRISRATVLMAMMLAASPNLASLVHNRAHATAVERFLQEQRGRGSWKGVFHVHDVARLISQIIGDDDGRATPGIKKRLRTVSTNPTPEDKLGIAMKEFHEVNLPAVFWETVLRHRATDNSRRSTVDSEPAAVAVSALAPQSRGNRQLGRDLALMDQYRKESQPDILMMLVEREVALENAEEDRRKLRRSLRDAEAKLSIVASRLDDKKTELSSLQEQVVLRPEKRNISKIGGYSLAIRRSRSSTTSAAAFVALCGRDKVFGGLKDAGVVRKFEHRAAAVLRVKNNIVAEQLSESLVAVPGSATDMPTGANIRSVRAVNYIGDATRSEAIQKSKMHLATLTIVACRNDTWSGIVCSRCNEGEAQLDLEKFGEDLVRQKTTCDMQIVNVGSGEETYRIMERQFQSTSSPTWEDLCNRSHMSPGEASVITMTLDNGPDNIGSARMIHKKSFKLIALWVEWCFFHQYHLIIKENVDTLDWWTFDEPSVESEEQWQLPTK